MGQYFVFENINVSINECYMFIFLINMIYEECMHITFVCMYTGKKILLKIYIYTECYLLLEINGSKYIKMF